MPITYNVNIEPTKIQNSFRITWHNSAIGAHFSFEQSGSDITEDEVTKLWLLRQHQAAIGNKLFRFLDGEGRYLQRALDESAAQGEPLLLHLRACKAVADYPFELLALDSNLLLSGRVHLVRRVSDWGEKKELTPEDRSLKLLFMACSALDVAPELDFEREEETIFRVTEKLAVDMEVEDSGSLEGLGAKLETEYYDIVHLSGHADIDRQGNPFFIMEDEAGYCRKVTADMLWQSALIENAPRLLFLSGCRTGETPEGLAALSFAHLLVEKYHLPAVFSWGRSVADDQATLAEEIIYKELSRGKDLLSALMRCRQELMEHFQKSPQPAWTMLRLYSNGMPLSAIVQTGQHARPKTRNLVHAYLQNSQVKVLREGFIGRRRQLQRSLRTLKQNPDKVGLLVHGTGGLGKSCLAGKICERFSEHQLIVVHGRLNAISLNEALSVAFTQSRDEAGKTILAAKKEMPEKLADLCAVSLKTNNYLLLFDDFEQNIAGASEGLPGDLQPETVPLLMALLYHLPLTAKMSQVLITSRHPFAITVQGEDWVRQRLEPIALTSFREAEQRKKARELPHIFRYPLMDVALALIDAGRGNPRLMEWIDRLVGELPTAEVPELLHAVQGKQQEFIEAHVIGRLLEQAGAEVTQFLCWFSVFRLPVAKTGAKLIAEKAGLADWKALLQRGIDLTLTEHDQARDRYSVSPLLQTCGRLQTSRRLVDEQAANEAAFAYYEAVCTEREELDPVLIEEWIYHALNCGREDVASRQGGRLVVYLGERLAFLESKRISEWVLSEKKQPLVNVDDAFLLSEYGYTLKDLGEDRKAIEYYEKSLKICEKVFGKKHAEVAIRLNNLGSAWDALGDHKKAIGYYEQALAIDRAVYGNQHPDVAIDLNNLGLAWKTLGETKKAFGYYEQALAIWKVVYGEQHPQVATGLNNLGAAWYALGDHKKAIGYYEQALAIDRAVYGDQHPDVARELNNLGEAWRVLGEPKKAIGYYEQALAIWKLVYGEQHPQVAIGLNNLGSAWYALGDHKKAIGYYEQALAIDRAVYGEQHPNVAIRLNNLGSVYFNLGEKKRAKEYFEASYEIFLKFFGPDHPSTRTTAEWLANL